MKCERCEKEFRYASELARHLSRKTKCERVEVEKVNKCKYCIKPCADMKAKTRHEKVCKFKDDYVRNLEIELDIELDIKYSNTTCRFCDKSMRVDTLMRHESTCKAKEIYKEKLIKMKENEAKTINNTYNDNSQNINIYLNNEHITYDTMKMLYIQSRMMKELPYTIACNLTLGYVRELFKEPKNKKCVMKHERDMHMSIYTEEGWKKGNKDEVMGDMLREYAELLSTQMEDDMHEEYEKKMLEEYKYELGDKYTDESTEKQLRRKEKDLGTERKKMMNHLTKMKETGELNSYKEGKMKNGERMICEKTERETRLKMLQIHLKDHI